MTLSTRFKYLALFFCSTMAEYAELLKKAKEKLPSLSESSERFEIPKVRGHLQGNRTVVTNFNQIVSDFHRKPEHFLKFLLKELATPGELKTNQLILGTKVHSSKINEKIVKYAEEFVLCRTCKKPDTQFVKEGDFLFLRCQACGAKRPIRVM